MDKNCLLSDQVINNINQGQKTIKHSNVQSIQDPYFEPLLWCAIAPTLFFGGGGGGGGGGCALTDFTLDIEFNS